jgi:hypothetical protein
MGHVVPSWALWSHDARQPHGMSGKDLFEAGVVKALETNFAQYIAIVGGDRQIAWTDELALGQPRP